MPCDFGKMSEKEDFFLKKRIYKLRKGGFFMRYKKTCVAVLMALSFSAGTFFQPLTAQAFNLGSILKVGGIAVVVNQFAGQLNSFINTLMGEHGVSTDYATKVVPIITIGDGGYVGAAQVTGPEELVQKTKAVLQLEKDFLGDRFRVRGLVPIDAKSATNFSRVQGVGVSAQIDVRI